MLNFNEGHWGQGLKDNAKKYTESAQSYTKKSVADVHNMFADAHEALGVSKAAYEDGAKSVLNRELGIMGGAGLALMGAGVVAHRNDHKIAGVGMGALGAGAVASAVYTHHNPIKGIDAAKSVLESGASYLESLFHKI